MVREKGKYEYNKQEIPEILKYNSDSDSSEISELRNSKKQKQTNNHNNSRNKLQVLNKKMIELLKILDYFLNKNYQNLSI